MLYVLSYTVVPERGDPVVVDAVSHADAVAKFVRDPIWLRTSAHRGTYWPEDGEKITVVGPDQDEFQARERALQQKRAWTEAQAPRRGRPSKHERRVTREEYEQKLAKLVIPEVRNHVAVFVLKHKPMVDIEYVSGLPEQVEEAA